MADLNESRQQQKNPLKCEICDKEFKSNSGIKNHFNLVHKWKNINVIFAKKFQASESINYTCENYT